MHNTDTSFAVGEDDEEAVEDSQDEVDQDQPWEHRDLSEAEDDSKTPAKQNAEYGDFTNEQDAWKGDRK